MDTLINFVIDNWLAFGGGALGGFLGLLLSYKAIGKIFRMIRTSTSDVASAPADEWVELVGKADGEANLRSPITQTPCVLWQVSVSERRSTGKSSHWVVVHSSISTVPFDIYDGTGRIKVPSVGKVELLLKDDVNKTSGLFRPLDEQTQMALNNMGVNTKGLLKMNKPMRVQERFIEQGDEIYVLGKTSANYGARIMESNSPLIISDRSKWHLLNKFFWQVVFSIIIGIFLGVILAVYFTNL